jgi:hypothetical protein
MINELVEEFVLGHNTIITAPTGNGSTVLTLHIANLLLGKDKRVLYYNSIGDIDTDFIKLIYPQLFTDVFFHKESLTLFTDFLSYIEYDIDMLIIDPADHLMINKNILPLITKLCKNRILCTSQIRQNPNMGGQIYSPIEELNKKYDNSLFKYSIWIRNVTEGEQTFKARYLDVYEKSRVGNKFIRRYLVRFDIKTGALLE